MEIIVGGRRSGKTVELIKKKERIMKVTNLPIDTQIKCSCGCEFEFEPADMMLREKYLDGRVRRVVEVVCPYCEKSIMLRDPDTFKPEK